MTIKSPDDLAIVSRDIRFEGATLRWWHSGDPVPTAFYNALSASFPLGERFFIDSVKRFRSCADTRLRNQIDTFIKQESIHTREHLAFNAIAEEHGYDLSRINAYLKNRIDWSRSRSPLEQLSATIALEHFTAILAHELLSDERHLADTPPTIAWLWRWHAVEEIEHKAVAYDTFLAATRDFSGIRRWFLRCYVMVITTVLFLHEIMFGVGEFFRQDKATKRMWLRLAHYLFVAPGIFRRIFGSYFAFYRPGFHPWRVDDRQLIAKFEPALVR